MSGLSLLPRLALRRGLTTSLRPLTSRLSTFAAPRVSATSVMMSGRSRDCEGVRSLSTSRAVRSEASGGSVEKLRIAIIGQSMFGRDVSDELLKNYFAFIFYFL